MVKEALKRRAQSPETKPKARDEANRCVEAIDLFLRNENALGTRAMSLHELPARFAPLEIEGVTVSIQPDVLVRGGADRFGAGIIRVAKAPDPDACKLDETKRRRGDHRREMGKYLVALLQMLLEAQQPPMGLTDAQLCFVADVRLGERIGPATDHTLRLRAIRGACRQIAQLWPNIEPRPGVLLRR